MEPGPFSISATDPFLFIAVLVITLVVILSTLWVIIPIIYNILMGVVKKLITFITFRRGSDDGIY